MIGSRPTPYVECMDDGATKLITARSPRRGRWSARLRRIAPWFLVGIAAVLAVLWGWTALTSHHSTPWYNDWLVILVLYAVFVALSAPKIVFPHLRRSPAPEPESSIVRTATAYLVAFFGGIWILGFPMQYSVISPVAAITEIGDDEVAIISYNRVGPRGLLQMAFGMESERVAAVDLATGHHLWDVQNSDQAFSASSVLGVDDGYAYVESPAGIRAFALADGSVDESRRPSEEIAQGWTVDDADPSGSMSTAAFGDRFVSIENGTLSISDDEETWEAIGPVGANDIDTEVTIVTDPIVHRHSTLTVYDDEYWREEAQALGGDYLVIQEESYRSWGQYDRVLRTVDAASGRVIDEIAIPQRVRGGMTAPTGTSIVMLETPMMSTTDLIIVSADGTIARSTIGRTGFFSEAL